MYDMIVDINNASKIWSSNVKAGENFRYLGLEGGIIIKMITKKYYERL
jgi:hypothetical protein